MFEKFIKRKNEKIIAEAQKQAETIIKNAKIEAQRLTCESAILNAIKQESQKIKDKTIKECKKLKEETQELKEDILKNNTSIYSIYRYSKVVYLNFNLWAVTDINNFKTGVVDVKGNQIIPCIYDEISGLLDGTDNILVMNRDVNNNYFGLVNQRGEVVIEPKYNDFDGGIYNNLWAVQLDNKWGFIDHNDNIVIPFKYDKVSCFSDNKAKVELNGESFYIDKSENRVA